MLSKRMETDPQAEWKVIHEFKNESLPSDKAEKINRSKSYNKKFRSFKSKENIHKKEVGPYHGFGY